MQTPIENADDLSRQTEIKYGPVKGGSTENFFKVIYLTKKIKQNYIYDLETFRLHIPKHPA